MLTADFRADWDSYKSSKPLGSLPDTSISFDEDGVMRIMVTPLPWEILPWCFKESPEPFASLHSRTSLDSHYCVLLRPTLSTATHKIQHLIRGEEAGLRGVEGVVYE